MIPGIIKSNVLINSSVFADKLVTAFFPHLEMFLFVIDDEFYSACAKKKYNLIDLYNYRC